MLLALLILQLLLLLLLLVTIPSLVFSSDGSWVKYYYAVLLSHAPVRHEKNVYTSKKSKNHGILLCHTLIKSTSTRLLVTRANLMTFLKLVDIYDSISWCQKGTSFFLCREVIWRRPSIEPIKATLFGSLAELKEEEEMALKKATPFSFEEFRPKGNHQLPIALTYCLLFTFNFCT